ncbi:MAG: tyrosine--tRNA ligase [Anaerolineales bacterium]|nr:tyrosine--tRNA ligase [Anaerolineales bacterium]
MKTLTIDEQVELLMQGTEYGDQEMHQAMADELRTRLVEAQKQGRPLKVYCGFDPVTSDLHLGHTVPMRKLRQFQELGHEVTFVVGNYTSLIGDPSDKDKLRPQLTQEEVAHNARTYAEQAFKILDRDQTKIVYNATWLSELSFLELIQLASNFTIQQFLTRENFRLRWDKGEPVYLHETFYAIMQGYDAYALGTDVQVGGTDQLFNIVTASRKVMAFKGLPPNVAIIMGILPGTDGEIKMSKSLGNHIALLLEPADMYGKIMSIPDKAMGDYFRLVTALTPPEIEQIEAALASGQLHPRDAKMRLGREIVSIYHSSEAAQEAEAAFVRVFQQGDVPEEMPEYQLQPGETVLDVLRAGKLVSSNSEGRRMLEQNAVSLDGEKLSDPNASFPGPGVLRVGRRKFLRVKA